MWLPKQTNLCLILGATKLYDGDLEERERHKKLNDVVKMFAEEHDRIYCIEIDDCIHDTSDFTGGINHFSTRVYYEIAQAMISVLEQCTGKHMESYSSSMLAIDGVIKRIRNCIRRFVKPQGRLYEFMRTVYNKVYKNRK